MTKKDKKKPPFVFEKFLFSLLRKAFKTTPAYHEALNKAKEEFFIPSKTGKPMRRIRFKCADCGRTFLPPESKKKIAEKEGIDESEVGRRVKLVAVDHHIAVISPTEGFQDWSTYIERLFCSVDNLRVLCNYSGTQDGLESCHKIKTKLENKQRNQALKAKKGKTK